MEAEATAFDPFSGEHPLLFLKLLASLGDYSCTAIGVVVKLVLWERENDKALPRDPQELAALVGAKPEAFLRVWNESRLARLFPAADGGRRFRMVGARRELEDPGTVLALKSREDTREEKNGKKVSSSSEGLLLFPGIQHLGVLKREDEEGTSSGTNRVISQAATETPLSGRKKKAASQRPTIPIDLAAIPGFTEEWNARIAALTGRRRPTTEGEARQLRQMQALLSLHGAAEVMRALDLIINTGWTGFTVEWYERVRAREQASAPRRGMGRTPPKPGTQGGGSTSAVRVRVRRRPDVGEGVGAPT